MKHTVRTSLLTSLSLLSASLLVGIPSAQAQECTEDADCEENFVCDQPPVGMGVTFDEPPSDGASTLPAPCDDPDGCDKTVPAGDEAPSGNVASDDPEPDSAPAPGDTPEAGDPEGGAPAAGRCEPAIITCEADSECPDPAQCDDGECVYHLDTCEADSECGAGYACIVIATTGECSGGAATSGSGMATTMMTAVASEDDPDPSSEAPMTSGGGMADVNAVDVGAVDGGAAPVAPTMGGMTAPDTAPTMPDSGDTMTAPAPDSGEMCTTTEQRACFPAPVACSSDDDCEGDWTCEAVPNNSLPAWEGIMKACLPPGLTAALEGHVRTGGTAAGMSYDTSLGGQAEQPGENGVPMTDGDTGSGPASGNGLESPVEMGTQGGTEGSTGCSTSAGTSSGGGFAWLGALGAMIFASRRRRERG